MPYIDPEVVIEAKKIDLLTYLKNYDPAELVHLHSNVYCTQTHNSLKISNGKWCWYSRGIGGRSAIDYLIKVRGMNFIEAIEKVAGQAATKPPIFLSKTELPKKKEFKLPLASNNNTNMINYLKSRGIDYEILCFCINTGRLYESYPYHNAVFVGADEKGIPRYAAIRGISFIGEAKGSEKRYSFSIPAEDSGDIIYLFESPIDLLSYATLKKINDQNWRQDNLLSLSGVFQSRKNIKETSIPIALEHFLKNNSDIKKIILCFDNDMAGKIAAQAIQMTLSKTYYIKNNPPSSGKDYNDLLCDCLKIPRWQSKERGNDAR